MRCFAIILLFVFSGCSKAKYDDHVILPNVYLVAATDDCRLLVAQDSTVNAHFFLVHDPFDATKMSVEPFTAKVSRCYDVACRQDGRRVYIVYSPEKENDRIVVDEYDVESLMQVNSWSIKTKYACSCNTKIASFNNDQLAISISLTCIGDDIPYVPEATFFHFDTTTGEVVKELQLNCLITDMRAVSSHSKLYISLQDPLRETSWLETWVLKEGQLEVKRSRNPVLRKELTGGKRIYLSKSPDDRYLSAADSYSAKNVPYTAMIIRTSDDETADVIDSGNPVWPAHKPDELWIHERSRLKATVINPDLTQTTTHIKAFGRMSDAIILFSNEESVIALVPNKSETRDLIARRAKKSE